MNNRKLNYWAWTVALAGFLFGFDTIVISGAEKTLQDLWQTSDLFHGIVVVSSALWGTVIGAMFGGIPTDRWGRKSTLFWIGILYTVSALGAAVANDPWTFALLRFVGGLGVGASTIAAPAYISEIAPPEKRGSMGVLYQFNIVFGILIAFISNRLWLNYGPESWRYMIGIETVPAVLFTLMVLGVPRSPRWLIMAKNDVESASKVLSEIYPKEKIQLLLDTIREGLKRQSQSTVWQKPFSRVIWLAFFIAFFNQFSGINAFLYYAPRIFESAGLGEESAFLSSIGIGIINLVFTFIGLTLIDRVGRKTLMYVGSVGYIISLFLVSLSFYNQWPPQLVPYYFFLFIGAHAIGQGAVIWVFISEIFPTYVRAQGQTIGTTTHWVLAASIPALVPVLFTQIGEAPVFMIFLFMMCLQFLWIYLFMPETKGKSLEQLETELIK